MLFTLLTLCFSVGLIEHSFSQPKEIYAEGSGFIIYTTGSVSFQSGVSTQVLEIEVLTGTWIGENCQVGVTERGGYIYFESNTTCEVQVTNHYNRTVRLTYQGISLTVLTSGYSYNGSFPGGPTSCYLQWSWSFELIHETYWDIFIGIAGLILLIIGLLLLAHLIRKYPLFSLTGKMLFDIEAFPICLVLILTGIGLIIMWLLS